MIRIERIKARNFLSIGNQWQEYYPKEGITLVTGFDTEKQRSNGAGKTTFLETIPMALFGQTTKGVTQAKTVNWKNKKNCEVKIYFSKEDTLYKIHRGIKPKILRLWIDGNEYESPASSVEFQKQIENDIIGMDFKTFCNLIHANPNNSISLFNSKKAEKRAFLERLFNLGEYSDLNKATNDKLRNTNTSIIEVGAEIENINRTIEYIKRDIAHNTVEGNSEEIENKIHDKQGEIIELQADGILVDKLESLRLMLKENESSFQQLDKKIYAVENQLEVNRVKLNKIGDVSKKRLLIKKAEERIVELSKVNYEQELENLQAQFNFQEKSYRNNKEAESVHRGQCSVIQKEINELPTGRSLKGKVECPTCYQKVDFEHVQEHLAKKRRELEVKHIEEYRKEKEYTEKAETCHDEMGKYNDKIYAMKQDQLSLQKLRDKVRDNNLDHYDELIEEQKKLEAEIKPLNEEQASLLKDGEVIVTDLKELEKDEEKIEELARDVEKLEKELEEIRKKEEIKTKKEDEVKEFEVKHSELTTRLTKLNTVKDYLEYIKESLKDENVKQYAISNILPFLNKQTNYYLSKSGHSFFVLLDGWLEAEIKGPGIGENSFDNFSGGETKSIDLALKFACMDIAGLQATTPIDILILDEILDSSIDGYGIKELMDIIKVKQEKNGLKVHIISHREEIAKASTDGEGKDYFNHYVKIKKEDGFSKIL